LIITILVEKQCTLALKVLFFGLFLLFFGLFSVPPLKEAK